jgi:hypothetical protein
MHAWRGEHVEIYSNIDPDDYPFFQIFTTFMYSTKASFEIFYF